MDEWMEGWVAEADWTLSPQLTAEMADMKERHPWYWEPIVLEPQMSRAIWNGNIEQWRDLVARYFAQDQVETAMRVMNCETGGTGNSNSYNEGSHASGLFQHLPKYWAERSAKAGWAGADIMDPEANVAVAAWLQRTGGWTHWTCY